MGGIGVWHPLCVLFYVCMVSSGLMFVSVYPGTKNDQKRIYNQKVARIREENQKIQSSNNSYEQKINSLKVQWAPRANWFSSEYSKINSLLNDFYSMNIIPVQYRNLASVIYLSDYMNSCEESFQMALLSTQIEEGIRRIERKLDAIASLLVQQIYETRCLRAENKVAHDRMDKQNRQMLDRLSSVEKYSSDAAKYAQLSSNYSKASAYFSLATYLKVSNR